LATKNAENATKSLVGLSLKILCIVMRLSKKEINKLEN
jgi:hypothetical protein